MNIELVLITAFVIVTFLVLQLVKVRKPESGPASSGPMSDAGKREESEFAEISEFHEVSELHESATLK
ncbi:MAG: hypothetical protein HF314_15475 [Ignavibacteria bacterium]|jgi:hypothetical protein|nr:hypothetical protein [Ignavibacteria bacterium]MCU7504480.1 hypothetical protein [Ignavibacteria bacterium]MCU7517941.1 hypothetical protein [Ignavibacteria bacterium]